MKRKLREVMLLFENEDGSLTREFTSGEEAERWETLNISVSTFAHIHNANPDWGSVKWKKEEFSKPEEQFSTSFSGKLPPYIKGESTVIAKYDDVLGDVLYLIYSPQEIVKRLSALAYNTKITDKKFKGLNKDDIIFERDNLISLLEYFRKQEEYETKVKENKC